MSAKIDRLHKIYKGRLVAKDAQELLAENICPECAGALPDPVREQRGDHHSELITYCPCGTTFTGGV